MIPLPVTTTGSFLLINKHRAADGNIPFIVDAVSEYIVWTNHFYCSYRMYLKDSEECLQNPQTKNMTTHRQCQAQFHPLQITTCISICKQDVTAKQGSSSLSWNITLFFLRKKSEAVRDGSGEKGDPGSSDAQQSCQQCAQGLLQLLSLCHPYTVGCKC